VIVIENSGALRVGGVVEICRDSQSETALGLPTSANGVLHTPQNLTEIM